MYKKLDCDFSNHKPYGWAVIIDHKINWIFGGYYVLSIGIYFVFAGAINVIFCTVVICCFS